MLKGPSDFSIAEVIYPVEIKSTVFPRGQAALFSRKNGTEIRVAAYTRVQAF